MAKKNDPVEEPPEIEEAPEQNPEPEATAPASFNSPLGAPMPTTTPETKVGFSYELGVDVKIADAWQKIRFSSNVNPSSTPKEIDGATYDDLGNDHPINVGETTQLDFYVQQQRLSDGKYMPEVEALLLAARTPGASIPVRWYDNPAEATPNPDDAFESVATVQVQRAQTGNADLGGWNFTLKIQGKRTKITNPATASGE